MAKADRLTFLAGHFFLYAFASLAGESQSGNSGDSAAPKVQDAPRWDAISQYEKQQLEGWAILVNKALLAEDKKDLREKTLKLLSDHLYRITRVVPAGPLEKLRKIAIWVELAHPRHPCMCYHESPEWLRQHDMNPEKAGCVEIANCDNFLKWTHEQPWMVLHELAHGYHHRVIGEENAEIKACYKHAVEAGLYDSVLHVRGRKERAYALGNHKEYFAELSEAFFGANDFYPFVRGELKEHDPEAYKMLEKLWEAGKPKEK